MGRWQSRGSYFDFSTESSVKSTLQSNVKGTGEADGAVRELLWALEDDLNGETPFRRLDPALTACGVKLTSGGLVL